MNHDDEDIPKFLILTKEQVKRGYFTMGSNGVVTQHAFTILGKVAGHPEKFIVPSHEGIRPSTSTDLADLILSAQPWSWTWHADTPLIEARPGEWLAPEISGLTLETEAGKLTFSGRLTSVIVKK